MNYAETVNYLNSLSEQQNLAGQVIMKRQAVVEILNRLGNPHLGRKTVHITGSKGKGSTSSLIASILTANGYSSALFTSPHLHCLAERICLNMKKVTDEEFTDTLAQVYDAVEVENHGKYGLVSTFGALTAMYFQLARKHNVDWQVVEAGLGGATDGTNVFDQTDIVVVTAISLEHTEILGKTTREIAENKAGLIKAGSTVIVAEQTEPEILEILKNRCKDMGATLIDVVHEYKVTSVIAEGNFQTFEVENQGRSRTFTISMMGRHQVSNATAAIAAIDAISRLGEPIAEEALRDGLKSVSVPGRLEIVPAENRTVIDGAHNGESMRMLVAALKKHFVYDNLICIVGANSDKNITEMLSALEGSANQLIVSKSQFVKAMSPQIIEEIAVGKGFEVCTTDSTREALRQAYKLCDKNDLVCVTGSLYLVAEARELLVGKDNWSLAAAGA